MDNFNNGPRPRPELIDVTALDIKCANCGNPIDKLPFNPTKKEDGTFGKIFCYQCNKERRRERRF
jgi:hypothetical protein